MISKSMLKFWELVALVISCATCYNKWTMVPWFIPNANTNRNDNDRSMCNQFNVLDKWFHGS